MTQAEFSIFMQQRGAVTVNKTSTAVFNGYPFAAAFGSGKTNGKTSVILTFRFFPNPTRAFAKELLAVAPKNLLNMSGNRYTGPNLVITVTAKNDADFSGLFDRFLASLAALAQKHGMFPPAFCPVCKKHQCDAYALQGTAYVPVHAACVQTSASEKYTKAEKNLREGNRGLGILGAVLGAAIGPIPAILCLYFTEYLVSILFALGPLCAYYGYKLFRGKMDKGIIPITIATTVLSIPYMTYATLALLFYLEGFRAPPLSAIFSEELIPMLLQISLFVVIGYVVVLGLIKRTGKTDIAEAVSSAQTLRPIQPAVPPQQAPSPPNQPF